MRAFLAILIATSLTANAWLAWRVASNPGMPESGMEAAAPPVTANAAPSVGVVPLDELETADAATCRDRLRAAGADDAMTRAIIEGMLQQRYRDQLKTIRVGRSQGAWWRGDARSTSSDEGRLQKEMVRNPVREALGRDPLDVSDAEKRYDFLPSEKRRLLAEIALDYEDLGATGAGWISGNSTQADLDKQRLLADERRRDVLAALTPKERAEYDLRFEGSAGLLSGRLAVMRGSEQEFRALRPLLDATQAGANSIPRGDGFVPAFAEFNQQELDKIAAAIGPERALDYQWSGPGLYAELVRFAEERGLPGNTGARIMQLAAETGAQASAIHYDTTVPAGEKGAALQRLQTEVRRDFDRLVPEPLRVELPAQAVDWFNMLAEGRYMGFTPSLLGTGTGVTAATSILTAARGRAWSPPPRPQGLTR